MKTQNAQSSNWIGNLYSRYHDRLLNFISARISNREDAENLAQDVWVRVLESGKEVCDQTASSFLHTVATNLVNDYLRRLYVRAGMRDEVARLYNDTPSVTPAHEYEAAELARFEAARVECLPAQRRTIYIMSRFDNMAVADIADALSLSFRTVENHLRMGRRDVRDFISAIA